MQLLHLVQQHGSGRMTRYTETGWLWCKLNAIAAVLG
jgi:hypothetical protein